MILFSVKPLSFCCSLGYDSQAVFCIATLGDRLVRKSYQTQSVSLHVLNPDYVIPRFWSQYACACVCLAGRAQLSLCFMGPLLHWNTTTSTMLSWSCRARWAMFLYLLQCSYHKWFANVYLCMLYFWFQTPLTTKLLCPRYTYLLETPYFQGLCVLLKQAKKT